MQIRIHFDKCVFCNKFNFWLLLGIWMWLLHMWSSTSLEVIVGPVIFFSFFWTVFWTFFQYLFNFSVLFFLCLFKFSFTLFFKRNLTMLCETLMKSLKKTFLTLNCLSRKKSRASFHFVSVQEVRQNGKNLVLSINFIDFLERWCRSLEFTVYVTIEKCWK